MRLATTDLFKAHWTDKIHDEWISALLRQNKYSREVLLKVKDLMDSHIKDAKVTNYESLIETLELPDPDDRHVLAAAIKCNADAIVTFNLKDFPCEILDSYEIEILHPDEFIIYQLDMAPVVCCAAIKQQRLALKNPPMNALELIKILQLQQLPQTALKLKEYIDFI